MNRYVNIGFSCVTVALIGWLLRPRRRPSRPGPATAWRPMRHRRRLGSVRIPRAVKADGKPLAAGTYQVRVTDAAAPPAPGQTPQYERWAEFLQGGQVKGREVVTVVPAATSAGGRRTPAAPAALAAELLKGGDYYRALAQRAGNHYLVHFNI